MTKEIADKKISRKTGREWRKDLMSRTKRGLADPHGNKEAKKKSIDRFYDAIHSGKFRGLTDRAQLSSYFSKPKKKKYANEYKKKKT